MTSRNSDIRDDSVTRARNRLSRFAVDVRRSGPHRIIADFLPLPRRPIRPRQRLDTCQLSVLVTHWGALHESLRRFDRGWSDALRAESAHSCSVRPLSFKERAPQMGGSGTSACDATLRGVNPHKERANHCGPPVSGTVGRQSRLSRALSCAGQVPHPPTPA